MVRVHLQLFFNLPNSLDASKLLVVCDQKDRVFLHLPVIVSFCSGQAQRSKAMQTVVGFQASAHDIDGNEPADGDVNIARDVAAPAGPRFRSLTLLID